VRKPDEIPNIFHDLKPVKGAVSGVKSLENDYDLYVLSTAPWYNNSSWQDKIFWIQKYFGYEKDSPFYKHVILTHNKGFINLPDSVLVDDRPYHGASDWDDAQNHRVWLQYGYDPRLVWQGKLAAFLKDAAFEFRKNGDLRSSIINVAKNGNYSIHGDKHLFKKNDWE
ncbi:hypothetical protein Q757_09565, partial [Oenococcus alcoholitolerans]